MDSYKQFVSEPATAFLENFYRLEGAERFFLTGGTALAAFYFHHRSSEDIDLFTTRAENVPLAEGYVQEAAKLAGLELTVDQEVKSLNSDATLSPALKLKWLEIQNIRFSQRHQQNWEIHQPCHPVNSSSTP